MFGGASCTAYSSRHCCCINQLGTAAQARSSLSAAHAPSCPGGRSAPPQSWLHAAWGCTPPLPQRDRCAEACEQGGTNAVESGVAAAAGGDGGSGGGGGACTSQRQLRYGAKQLHSSICTATSPPHTHRRPLGVSEHWHGRLGAGALLSGCLSAGVSGMERDRQR